MNEVREKSQYTDCELTIKISYNKPTYNPDEQNIFYRTYFNKSNFL